MLKGLVVLVSGSALAQLIGIIASPLLSRLYTPENFGLIGLVMSIVSVLSVTSSLKYEMALVVEEDDEKVNAIQYLCWQLLLVFSAVITLGLLTAPLWWHFVSVNTNLQGFLPWIPPILFLTGLYNIYNFRLNRERNYKDLSKANVLRRLSVVGTQVVMGFCGAHAIGLILGNLMGVFVAVVVLFLSNKDSLRFKKTERGEMKKLAKKHYRFAAYTAPQSFLNTVSQSLPIYLLGYFYGIEVIGAYWFTARLLQMPAALVGSAVSQVFYKEASSSKDSYTTLKRLHLKTVTILASLIAPVVLVLFIWGSDLFVMIFGNEWEMAGSFSSCMIFWLALVFCNSPTPALFSVLNLQKVSLFSDIGLILLRLGSLLLGGLFLDSAIQTITLFSGVGALFQIFLFVFICYELRRGSRASSITPLR